MLRLLSACSLLVLAAACDVKDPIFNTPHPDHGTVTLTTDWSGIGIGLTTPESYTVTATRDGSTTIGYTATLTGITNRLDHLFDPGTYRFCVYNTPERVSINGSVASVAAEAVTPTDAGTTASGASPADNSGQLISNAPGWLFSSTLAAALTADTEHTLTAQMQQQVRELTLIIEPSGGTTDRIAGITGTLSGVAGSFDIADGTHAAPSLTALTFTKITTGAHAGKWCATVRLLGIAGTQQRLTATLRYADDNPKATTLDSDLSTALATFNDDKRTPMTLDGTIVETPTEAGFGATIADWVTVTGDGPVVAE